MKSPLLCLLVAGTMLLSACGPDLQQQVDTLQQTNTALYSENLNLRAQIAGYNRAQALAEAKAKGVEQARIQAGERLATVAPACDIVPFACSASFRRQADFAAAHFPADPPLAIAWTLVTAAVLLALVVGSLNVLWGFYARSWRPELDRARAAREILATADTRRAEVERMCDAMDELVAQERRRLQLLQEKTAAAGAGLEDVGRQVVAARSELARLHVECEHMRSVRDALSGL